LLLYNGKRLHIHASMTTCIWLYVTDTPILSIFSSLGDESRNEQHSSTTAPPANDKTPRDLYFKTDCWHFLLSVLSCGRNWLEPCGNDSIIFASRTSFPLSPPIPDAAHRCSA
jgi:hypothetical protein